MGEEIERIRDRFGGNIQPRGLPRASDADAGIVRPTARGASPAAESSEPISSSLPSVFIGVHLWSRLLLPFRALCVLRGKICSYSIFADVAPATSSAMYSM